MESIRNETLDISQQKRLQRFGVPRCVDVHCHCLVGLDDGPQTWPAAIALCRKIVEDGITTVIATPHQLGRYDRFNSATKICEAVDALNAALAQVHIPLEVLPGGDVRVDEQLLSLLDAGEVMTLAGRGKHLLLELPHELYVDPRPLLDALIRRGIRPIVTHPERYRYLWRHLDVVASWVDRGAIIQITAGSLLGNFGGSARTMAMDLVLRGLVELVATDAHDAEQRNPCLSAALEILAARLGIEFARRICLVNPLAVAEGRDMESEGVVEP